MDESLKQYLDEQFKSVATKDELLELVTKTGLEPLKSDIADIKEIVMRIDKRTDEDLKAVIKDVENTKKRVVKLESKMA